MAEFWDEWRGSFDGRPVMYIKRLLRIGGWRLDLHKFVRADDEGCFHTHPAYALRVVLWGGYEEEVEIGTSALTYHRFWGPLNFGIVQPTYCHRVSKVLNGVSSYSLWLRAPAWYDVQLRGNGWPKRASVDNTRAGTKP